MDTLWSALVGGVGGAVAAFIGIYLQNLAKVDEGLRDRRSKDYLKLWDRTRILPLWPKDDVTYEQLDELTKNLRDWYFSGGGLFLSRKSRQAYGAAQDALCATVAAHGAQSQNHIGPEEYDRLQKLLSALRTELTEDLLSRQRSALGFLGRGDVSGPA